MAEYDRHLVFPLLEFLTERIEEGISFTISCYLHMKKNTSVPSFDMI